MGMRDRILALMMQNQIGYLSGEQLSLIHIFAPQSTSTDEMLKQTVDTAKLTGLVHDGDVVVISAGVPLSLIHI